MLQDRSVDGAEIARRVDSVSDIAPRFVHYLMSYPFAHSQAEAGLDNRSRALATVAGLTVLGSERQLRIHIADALALGWTPQEIVEAITQMADYAGITAALNALAVAKQVFAREGAADPD
jgi:4-carboxymuconolactone decarboxylase